MKDINGNDLAQPYYDLAVMRREKEPCDSTIGGFTWISTPEKYEWWHEVYKGNHPPIPDTSLAELEAWRREKEFEKREKTEPDWKAKYENRTNELNELMDKFTKLREERDDFRSKYNEMCMRPLTAEPSNFIAKCVPFQKCPVCDGYGEVRPLWNKNAQEPTYVKCSVCDGNKVILMYNAEAMAAEGRKSGHLFNTENE